MSQYPQRPVPSEPSPGHTPAAYPPPPGVVQHELPRYDPQPPRQTPPPQRPEKGDSGSIGRMILTGVLLAILLLIGINYWNDRRPQRVERVSDTEPRKVTPRGDLAEDEQATIDLFRSASPSVVHITSVAVRRDVFSLNVMQIPRGSGTGFVWDDRGHVVTNFHVIENADRAKVKFSTEEQDTYDAVVVGRAPDQDLAVLKIDAPQELLQPLRVGRSSDLDVGQKVFAIGNPFGLDQTLTTGVISGLGREIKARTGRTIQDVIQTDAAINPGNSGGPLLDSSGLLIGVNTAIFSPSGAYAGIGFAIPVDSVNRVVPDLLKFGKVMRPALGVYPAPDRLMRQIGLKGVLVLRVQPESGAAAGGVRPTQTNQAGEVELGDVIIAVDDSEVETNDDLFTALEAHEVGDIVTVRVLRGARSGNERELEMRVQLQGSE